MMLTMKHTFIFIGKTFRFLHKVEHSLVETFYCLTLAYVHSISLSTRSLLERFTFCSLSAA